MKNIKAKNRRLLMLLIGVTILTQPSVRVEVGLGEVLGTAWTIGDVIIGETTLTPAYAVDTWNYRLKGTEQSPSYSFTESWRLKVTRDILGQYFYYSKYEEEWNGILVHNENQYPFPVFDLNKLNYSRTCIYGLDVNTVIAVETHTEKVWMAHVEQTGLWPDDGPWTVWLKTAGHQLYGMRTCGAVTQSDRPYWVPATIGKRVAISSP